ncbi:MAG: glycoside hydrolase family 3 N-terminal domain-containing protein, partial [Faecousia sp.]
KTDADIAIYVISRISGESADRRAEKGDYYLSDVEEQELAQLARLYRKLIVVLNVGGVMDLGFLDRLPVAALVLMSQAGMEGGNALADVLTGAVPFSGKLTDTWAYQYEDYPSSAEFGHRNGNLMQEKYTEGIFVGYRYFDAFGVRPRFPFGFGLSYTRFRWELEKLYAQNGMVCTAVRVENVGSAPGREVMQLYASCPQVTRVKERRRLVAFGKTRLLGPGESQVLTLGFDPCLLASYHTGRAQYFLDAGCYGLSLGNSSQVAGPAAKLTLGRYTVTEQLTNICPLLDALTEITPPDRAEEILDTLDCPTLALDGLLVSKQKLPQPRIRLEQAREILAKMNRVQKAQLVCGQPSQSSGEIIGSAALHVPGAAGETTNALEKLGIGSMILADGPAGLRLQKCYEENPADGSIYRMDGVQSLQNRFFGIEFPHEGSIRHYQFCTAIPVGTLLAQSFDVELMEQVGGLIGREMKELGVTLWLAPGMNIHRNPLCGRNFEYYSEDPVLSGVMAAAVTKGVQQYPGIGVTIKHFACNNQEDNRMGVSSVVSERALREIYLKGFEIAVKQAQPMAIMTSYNRVNSVHAANSFDLCTTAAREEWGFGGIIMTDWLTTNQDHGSSAVKCIQAGNDLIMPGNESDVLEILDGLEAKKDLRLKESDLDDCVTRILEAILASDVCPDSVPYGGELQRAALVFCQ